MKIISKYKDYYDYLQGIYGVDNNLILNRLTDTPILNKSSNNGVYALFICGKVIEFYIEKGIVYFGDDIAQFNNDKFISKYSFISKNAKYAILRQFSNRPEYVHYPMLSDDVYGIYRKVFNDNCPIFVCDNYEVIAEYPCLSDIGINKVLSPNEIWIMLSNWLSQQITKKEAKVPVGSDKERIITAGFDLKTSFRNIK